jgi:hypothetical protein
MYVSGATYSRPRGMLRCSRLDSLKGPWPIVCVLSEDLKTSNFVSFWFKQPGFIRQ